MTEGNCPACSGELQHIGDLGHRRHYRCRACGIGCSEKIDEVVCAICANPVERSMTTAQPLGKGGALVIVCADCETLDAGDERYGFESTSRGGVGPHSPVGSGNKRKGSR